MLIKENIPCWYELSWNAEVPAIILKIHKDFIKHRNIKLGDLAGIVDFNKNFSYFGDFESDFQGNIGFSGVLRHYGEDGEFIKFAVDIPTKGKNYDLYEMLYRISASFTILFTFLYVQEYETKCKFPQLLTINTTTHEEMCGGSVGGQFSVSLVNWLKTFNPYDEILEIKKATKKVYEYIFFYDDVKIQVFDYRAELGNKDGGLVMDCPGHAAGIFPEIHHDYDDKTDGYKFSCDNVDSPAQQLVLLSGLAALHDKARREIKTKIDF